MATDSREHIMKVSLMLFLQKSYKAVTMKEIVEKTGLSKGGFYHYFESKDQLFIEVFKNYYSDVLQDNFKKYNHGSLKEFYIETLVKGNEMFKKLLKSSGKQAMGKANHFLMLFEAAHRNPKFRKLVNELGEKEIDAWKKVVEKAQQSGEVKNTIPAEEIAKMFIFMGDGYGMHHSFRKTGNPFNLVETRNLYDDLYELLKA